MIFDGPGRREAVLLYFTVCAGLLLVLSTGLVTDFGEWYSRDFGYRRQTDAFLNGRIALHETPAAMLHDYCWDNGKLQQVWGLGIPTWRLPFEFAARLVGEQFPDRLSFALAYALAAYLVIKAFFPSASAIPSAGHRSEDSSRWGPGIGRIGAAVILLAFPPFISVCRTRFDVYEEAAAYTYLYGISLFSGLLIFQRRCSFLLYTILALFSGLGPLLRPTLVFYGGITFALSSWMAWKMRFTWKRIASALFIFVAALSLLFFTNWLRFGKPMEFGHSLNFSDLRARYATRFENPFRKEPFLSSAHELWGALFQVNSFNKWDWYKPGLFPGQSQSPRWREFYFSTYDLSFAGLLAAAWIWSLLVLKKRKQQASETTSLNLTLFWSLVPTIPLFVFYLHSPALTSRYTLDFAPAFAVALAGLWMRLTAASVAQSTGFQPLWPACCFLSFWLGCQIATIKIEPDKGNRPALKSEQLISRLQTIFEPISPLPGLYRLNQKLSPLGIPHNGNGWNLESGQTEAMVNVFVDHPEQVTIHVEPVHGAKLSEAYYDSVRAKIGLEELRRVSVTDTNGGKTIIFSGPRKARYQRGIQVFFLAMMPPEDVGRKQFSDLRLTGIEWMKANERTLKGDAHP